MSGPLAQQFAQVRKDIAGCCEGVACDPGKCDRDLTLAALSVIERHVQDMETALLDRALLSANPPQGDAAEGSSPSDGPDDFCEHGYTTEDSAHPSAGLERCPTCSPSDGGGVRPADDPHSLVAKAILPDGGGAK